MAEPITLTDEEAAAVLRTIFDQIQRYGAMDVMHGIENSRRLGIEEDVSKEIVDRGGELKRVGMIRRRPATNIEMLRIVFEELRQRLIVLPAIVNALEQRIGSNQFAWRVDREFVSQDLLTTVEADMDDLRPPEIDQLLASYEKAKELIPDLIPAVKSEVV
jgi:hypothetical protein